MDNEEIITLGQKLRQVRVEKEMTQKELAGNYITRNMLSQIENDTAAPSIKTLNYLAKKLNTPISYFVDNQSSKYDIASDLLRLYDNHNYIKAIEVLENHFEEYPKSAHNDLLRNIYINSCLQGANQYKKEKDYIGAKTLFDKLLTYESDMLFESDVSLYNIYNQLAEISIHLECVEQSKDYDEKAKHIVDKMVASRQIQNIYFSFIEGDYKEVIKKNMNLDVDELDHYNQGRYYMITGAAYYYIEAYEKAIVYLEKAISYYKNSTYNSVLKMIYDNLSKCYSNINNYKKAYEYLNLVRQQENLT